MEDLTQKAMGFAISAHSTQVRKYTNEPYWKHLAEVAGIVASVTPRPEVVAAAWLHDVLEDTPTTDDQVIDSFGMGVFDLVSFLTDWTTPDVGNRAFRTEVYCSQLADSTVEAKNIKLADIISNVGSVVQHDPKFAKVYVPEKRMALEVCKDGDPHLVHYARSMVIGAEDRIAGR